MKEFIREKLLTKSGLLDSNKIKFSYFKNNNLLQEYNFIIEITDFLPQTVQLKERIYCILNDVIEQQKCKVCDNPVNFKNSSVGYYTYCSTKCRSNDVSVKEKIKTTCLEKYDSSCFISSDEFKEKSRSTKLEKYGTENLMTVSEIKQRVENTNLKKYGSRYGFGSSIIQKKIKITNNARYGSDFHNCDINVLNKLENRDWLKTELSAKPVFQIAKELGCSESFVNKWSRIHNLPNRIAKYSEETEIVQYLIECGINPDSLLLNSFDIVGPGSGKIGRRQLDIYIPEKRLAIEVNGLYYHKNDKFRHKEKLNLCENSNVKLLQFWDYQWNTKQNICKSILNNFLNKNIKIYARKCQVKELTFKEYSEFMVQNHMHGCAQASKRFGLFFENRLVSCIGFGKSRYSKNNSWELIRYANLLNTNVVGGFSKLLQHFRKDNSGSIISYCDLMLFTGRMYDQAGFKFVKNTDPNFFYFKGSKIKSREQMQKHKLAEILKDFDLNLTADENLSNNGWHKVWNCGNGVWELL